MMVQTIIALAVVLPIIGAFACTMWAIFYHIEKREKPQISFRAFRSLYEISPYKWDINDLNPCYRKTLSCELMLDPVYMKTFYGHLQYLHFRKLTEKHARRKRINDNLSNLVEQWQKDIDRYRENSYHEIRERAKKITRGQTK